MPDSSSTPPAASETPPSAKRASALPLSLVRQCTVPPAMPATPTEPAMTPIFRGVDHQPLELGARGGAGAGAPFGVANGSAAGASNGAGGGAAGDAVTGPAA